MGFEILFTLDVIRNNCTYLSSFDPKTYQFRLKTPMKRHVDKKNNMHYLTLQSKRRICIKIVKKKNKKRRNEKEYM